MDRIGCEYFVICARYSTHPHEPPTYLPVRPPTGSTQLAFHAGAIKHITSFPAHQSSGDALVWKSRLCCTALSYLSCGRNVTHHPSFATRVQISSPSLTVWSDLCSAIHVAIACSLLVIRRRLGHGKAPWFSWRGHLVCGRYLTRHTPEPHFETRHSTLLLPPNSAERAIRCLLAAGQCQEIVWVTESCLCSFVLTCLACGWSVTVESLSRGFKTPPSVFILFSLTVGFHMIFPIVSHSLHIKHRFGVKYEALLRLLHSSRPHSGPRLSST